MYNEKQWFLNDCFLCFYNYNNISALCFILTAPFSFLSIRLSKDKKEFLHFHGLISLTGRRQVEPPLFAIELRQLDDGRDKH